MCQFLDQNLPICSRLYAIGLVTLEYMDKVNRRKRPLVLPDFIFKNTVEKERQNTFHTLPGGE